MTDQQQATKIILARHGEAAYPTDGESDASGGILTQLGEEQARGLGDRLQDQQVGAIFCSELSRARQTAEIVGDILQLPVGVRAGLHEYVAGDEPFTLESVGMTLMQWLSGDPAARMLGGESGAQISGRILPVLNALAEQHRGKTVLVVIPGGAIIATLGSIAPGATGLPTDGNPWNLQQDIANGASFSIEYRSGGWHRQLLS